ncbi:hepcidin-like [Chanos chanos]|uniref:Hepcidin-like n=1 Tax=Chanos chanos TaxID=29144 RepID=A0A6J2W174_CHACN|nr:hepcidin-like [Chanos chanos]
MKYISVCLAATVIIAYLCILETSALPLAEVDEPSNNEVLPEMELTETSQEQPSSRRCRFCCKCCPSMRGCGICCR